AHLPASRFAAPATEITLTVRECFKPEPPDRRTLGVVFRSLTLLLGAVAEAEGQAAEKAAANAAADSGWAPVPAIEHASPPEPSPGGAARRSARRGKAAGHKAAPAPLRRALVIDDSVPEPDKDAGSNAVLQHIRSLQRLGCQVGFVPADNMTRIDPYTRTLE